MFNLFAIVPFFILLALAYYMNSKKIKDEKIRIFLLSLIETTFAYLILLLLFLQNFYPKTWYFMLTVLLVLIISVVLYFFLQGSYEDSDLQIETIKNVIVIFMLTILPFYVFLTIFRFIPFYFQIPLSISLSALLFYLALKTRISDRLFYKKTMSNISFIDDGGKFLIVWGLFGFIAIIVVLFQFPSNTIGETLNLSNNVGYFSFNDLPTDIDNNFYQTEIFTLDIDTEFRINETITDYYYNDSYFYFYTSDNRFFVYDLETKEKVFDKQLDLASFVVDEDDILRSSDNYNRFMYYENNIILFARYHTYIVTEDSSTNISEISDYYAMFYYEDNVLYFVNNELSGIYEIFKFENDSILLSETIDLNTTSYDSINVISGNLFYRTSDELILYADNSISFEILSGSPAYDGVNQVMYYTSSTNHSSSYNKVDSNGTVLTFTLDKVHNDRGIIIGDYIYFTNKYSDEINNIEIFNNDFDVDSIFNHLETDSFWVFNKYHSNYIGNYRINDNLLEYIQLEKAQDFITISVYQLDQKDVDIDFPFYSHYGVSIFIPIMIAFCIPITNWRKSIVVLDQSKSYYDRQIK